MSKTPLNRAFFYAIQEQDIEIVRILIKEGVDANSKFKNEQEIEHPALNLAVHANNPSIVKLLVENGADVNAQSSSKITPLLAAVAKNNFEITKFLLKAGADTEHQTEHGDTALVLAVQKQLPEIVALLIEHGANVQILTNKIFNFGTKDKSLMKEIKEIIDKSNN